MDWDGSDPQYYYLDGHTPVPIYGHGQTFRFLLNRTVAHDTIEGVRVSTIFLGVNQQWGDGPPLLFETMVFGGKLDEAQARYSTWEEAETGHAVMLTLVKTTLETEHAESTQDTATSDDTEEP